MHARLAAALVAAVVLSAVAIAAPSNRLVAGAVAAEAPTAHDQVIHQKRKKTRPKGSGHGSHSGD